MQKVREYKKSISAYETYLEIKEKILNIDFIESQYHEKDQQNTYYSLYIYFFYKYCKALIKDN